MTCHHGCHGCCGDHGNSEALKRADERNKNLSDELKLKSEALGEKSGQITAINKELSLTKTQLTEAKGELTTTRKDLKDLGDLFKKLEIESNDKDKEIEVRTNDVRNLKTELGKSQEEIFDLKLREQEKSIKDQEKKLDDFVQQLGISREKPRELRKAYYKLMLIKARENYNQSDIMDAEDDIEIIKD